MSKRDTRTLHVLTGRTEALQCRLGRMKYHTPVQRQVLEHVRTAKNALLAALRAAESGA